MNTNIQVHKLGIVSYSQGLALQERFFNDNIKKKIDKDFHLTSNHIILCQHAPVITLGKSGKYKHLLKDETTLLEQGIAFSHVNRGGDITAHNPGQLVVYPILDLEFFFTDIKKYVNFLEESIIRTMADFDIEASRSHGETGVWIGVGTSEVRKIAAIGVKTSRWITMHGMALNVNNDLKIFENIIPCGIADKRVTSMSLELGDSIEISTVENKLLQHFMSLFLE